MKIYFFIFLALFFATGAFAQTNHLFIKAGTQIPFQHTFGTEFVLNSRIGFQMQYGLLTAPYEGNIRKVVALYETNEDLLQIIEDSFQSGTILGAGFNYHFGKNYIGGFGQYISLRNTSSASAALRAYYGFDFSILDVITGPVNLTLQSNLYNAGILYGRRFMIHKPNLQLHLEAGISKNITSRNVLQSNRPNIDNLGYVQNLYGQVDHSLRETYLTHLIIPTFNIYLVYDLMGR